MAEKWDEGANDSPEVVYEGFSPPPTHSQGLISAGSSFLPTDSNENNQMGAPNAGYMNVPQGMEDQREGPHPEEADRSRMCFVCCNPVSDKNFETIKASMNHSHAPLLVLLTDVLGYKLEEGRLHSQVVCKACYHLLDIIDELQQTLTESKTDVRTKFLETVQKLKLKYPRTDKMLKPRCLRCIQMSQSSARKRGRGRGWKGRFDDGRGRGRGRGKGRGQSQSNDGSDNDGEGQGVSEGEICKDVLPSKSLHQSSRDLPTYKDCSCIDTDTSAYECLMCSNQDTDIVYQYCESCLTCQGTFVPWGVNVTLRFVGDQCSIGQIDAQSFFDEELLCILTKGLKQYKEVEVKNVSNDEDDDNQAKKHVVEITESDSVKDVGNSPTRKIVLKSFTGLNKEVSAEDKALFKSRKISKRWHRNTIKVSRKRRVSSKSEDLDIDEMSIGTDIDYTDLESGEEDTSFTHRTIKEELPDIDLAALKPILKIQESRKTDEVPIKRKSKQSHKTLSEEFDSILSRPTLGKRKIKPTEKVKWLAESCMPKRKDTQAISVNRKKVVCEFKVKEESGKSYKNDSESSASEKSPKKIEKENANLSSSNSKEKYIHENEREDSHWEDKSIVANVKVNKKHEADVVGKCDDERRDTDEDDNAEESKPEKKVIKSEKLDVEDTDYSEVYDKSYLEDLYTPGRPGRRPGKRKYRSGRMSKYVTGHDYEKTSVIKLENGKEIDLKTVSIKALHNGEVYSCPLCNKEYRSQGGMHYHLATHCSYSRYSCSLCPYKTIRHGDLKKHFVIHTGLKPYKCDECSQEFATSSSFRRHVRVHTGEKPYKCDVCGKDFRNITTRKQHMILHTGIKNFVCEVCGKSFALKHHYASHRKRHNGEMPFRCIHCDAAFKTHNAVKVHRKKEHPIEEAERIQQNRQRRKSSIKSEQTIKIEDDSNPIHEVYHEPGDVLVQAMAATVETVEGVHYEYVDVTDPAIPLVSKMIKENWNGRDSVVLTITHVEEEEYNDDEDGM